MIVLSADIGGTNSRLALVELDGATPRIIDRMSAPSRRLPPLGAVVRELPGVSHRGLLVTSEYGGERCSSQ